jgi:hypothetical protein
MGKKMKKVKKSESTQAVHEHEKCHAAGAPASQ